MTSDHYGQVKEHLASQRAFGGCVVDVVDGVNVLDLCLDASRHVPVHPVLYVFLGGCDDDDDVSSETSMDGDDDVSRTVYHRKASRMPQIPQTITTDSSIWDDYEHGAVVSFWCFL